MIPFPYVYNAKKYLIPNKGLTRIHKPSPFNWLIKDASSASFTLRKRPILSGWYMIEIKITASKQYLDSLLSFDYIHPLKKNTSCPVLLISDRTTKRVIFLPPSIRNIEFYPSEQEVSFRIDSLRLVKLTKSFALHLMLKKLKTFRPDQHHEKTLIAWKYYSLFFKEQKKSETDYPVWLQRREKNLIKQELHLNQRIKFTIILNIRNSSELKYYSAILSSISKQTYSNWELIIISKRELRTLYINTKLNYIEQKNPVIKLDGGNTSMSEILKHSNGLYYLFLSKNTILSTHALSVYARNIQNKKDALLFYADDDVLDDEGTRSSPNFKPDWNPDLLLSHNYIGECFVTHSCIAKLSKNLKISENPAWLYEILISQSLEKIRVEHISLILNHKINNSTTENTEKFKILNTYLSKYQAIANFGVVEGTFRIAWPIEKKPPLVSIIIPTRDSHEILKKAIDSILDLTDYSNYEIIIIDNQSQCKESINYLKKIDTNKKISVINYDKPFNYSEINNFATTKAKGTILALLNNDVEIISPNWLGEMVSHADRSDIGCVGAMLYYPDERIQHAGVIIGLGGCAGHSHKFYSKGSLGYSNRLICTQNYSAVTAACLVVSKTIYQEVGGFNEESLAVAFNDVDFCLRVQAQGYRNLWTPWAELYHHESVSRGKDDSKSKRDRLTSEIDYMKKTWNTVDTIDPYYSKFLTKIREDFSFGL